MSWIAITEDHVKQQLSGFELETFRGVMLSDGEVDPIAGIIDSVTKRVRGYVQGCARNHLSTDATLIPDTLLDDAVALIVIEVITRSGGRVQDPVEARRARGKDAMITLRAVANCNPPQELPDDGAPLATVSSHRYSISARDPHFGQDYESGA